MNCFEFFRIVSEFFVPQTVFIGGWGTKFKKIVFLNILDLKR
jgi:hypothetical protein